MKESKIKLIPRGQEGFKAKVAKTLDKAGEKWNNFWNSEFTTLPIGPHVPTGIDPTKKQHSGMTNGDMGKMIAGVTAAPAVAAGISTVGLPATAATVAGSYVGSQGGKYAGRQAAKAVGAGENAQEMLGDLGEFAGGFAGGVKGSKYEIKPLQSKGRLNSSALPFQISKRTINEEVPVWLEDEIPVEVVKPGIRRVNTKKIASKGYTLQQDPTNPNELISAPKARLKARAASRNNYVEEPIMAEVEPSDNWYMEGYDDPNMINYFQDDVTPILASDPSFFGGWE